MYGCFDATWHFYFDAERHTYLAIECPWRITSPKAVLIGCEDFDSVDGGGAESFPTSDHEIEWLFRYGDTPSLILMGGSLH